ncbi:MAG: hemerythrin domain-containing protein [Rhodocyclaceae bacterium]|nr:hemerythrin domain-containing protein [Rhodocyclaceae bacterium]MDZ4214187.1 hemerythrin domain-containing protein [Rhodocyclaceae bacterium]
MSTETLDALQYQHQQVMLRFDEFSRLLYAADQRAATQESLVSLIVEIGMHFGFEESLMEAGDYAEFDHHRRQHLGIMTELGLMVDRLESGLGLSELARGVDFLRHWYEQHMDSSDCALEAWLRLRS